MLKRFALMIAATAVLAIPASSAFGASAPRPNGALPEEACFAAMPDCCAARTVRAGQRGSRQGLNLRSWTAAMA